VTVTINGNPPSVLQKQELAQAFGLASSDSPALTGTPTVPTAPAGTNTTQIASTAFVKGEVGAVLEALPSSIPAYVGPTNVTPVLTVNHTTGVAEWTSTPALAQVDTSGDLLVAGMTMGLGGGAGDTNIALGTGALESNTTGFGLAAVGATALASNTTGIYNAALGYAALSSVFGSSSYNTAVGTLAGSTVNGSHNTIVGANAGSTIQTGSSNTLIGRYSGTATMSGTIVLSAGTTVRAWCDNTGKWGFGTNAPTAALDLSGDSIRVRTAATPASASATGETGTVKWDANYVYVCTAPNTWKAAALTALGSPAPMQATISNGLAVVQIEGFPYALLPVGVDGALVANFSQRSDTLDNLMTLTGNPSEIAVPTDDLGLVTYNAAGVARHFPRLDSPDTTFTPVSLAISPKIVAGLNGVNSATTTDAALLATAIGVNAVAASTAEIAFGSIAPGVNRRFLSGTAITSDNSLGYIAPHNSAAIGYPTSAMEVPYGVYYVKLNVIVRDIDNPLNFATFARTCVLHVPALNPATDTPYGPATKYALTTPSPDVNVGLTGIIFDPDTNLMGNPFHGLLLYITGLVSKNLRWVLHAELLTMTDEVMTWPGLS
jgi:hypothetical protein